MPALIAGVLWRAARPSELAYRHTRKHPSPVKTLCARAPPSHPAHPGLPATCSAAPVSPEMRVARVKNGPEPAEHGLQLGGCLSCRDAPPAGLRPTFTFAPLPRGDGTGVSARAASIVNTHSRGLHRERAQPGAPSRTRTAGSADLSFRASPAWRVHFLYHWRVEPGTRTAPMLGHRAVRVRWYPARFLKFCRRHGGEPHLPATGPTLRSGVGLDLGGVGGGGMPPPVTLAAPAALS